MSGVEVATVALKLFPVLLKALDDWFRIFEGTKDWWSFKETYKTFLKSIRFQSLQYKKNIQIFVSPLGLDLEENGNLHENPDSRLWHDPTIRAKLRNMIDHEGYEWFLDQLKIISDALKELVAKIKITDAGTVKQEIYRLNFSFDKTRDSLLGKLATANDQLFRILNQDSFIVHHVKDSGYVKSCKKLQSQATALYNILQRSLKCVDTTHIHNCSVSADWSERPAKEVQTAFLKVLFGRSPEWKQLRWEVEESALTLKPEPEITAVVSDQEVITRAARETKKREWHGDLAERGKRHAIGIVTVAATLTSIAPGRSCPETLWQERIPNKLKRKINILGRKDSAMDKTIPDGHDKNQQNSTKAPSETKPTKLVRFDDTTSGSETAANEEAELQDLPISDMCAFLRNPAPGRLKEDTGHAFSHPVAFHFEPDDQSSLEGSSLQTLASFISATKSLPDRIRLGLCLVRTVISYGESGWVPPPLDRQKVFVLLGRNRDRSRATPYVTHDSVSRMLRTQEVVDRRIFCKNVLFSLGVILLELADGRVLEATGFWTEVEGLHKSPELKLRIVVDEWHQYLQQRQPDDLCEPIRRCLGLAFGSLPHLEDSEFLNDVFNGVVRPLEEFLCGWKR